MANWNVLKAAVANIINANGNQEITGQLLQNVLNNIITNVGENATFAGIATLDTNPGAPDGPVFYLATTVGVYPNFNGLEVLDGEAIIFLWNNSAWTKKVTGFATQEKMQELEENTNEKLSQLGSRLGYDEQKSIPILLSNLFDFSFNGTTFKKSGTYKSFVYKLNKGEKITITPTYSSYMQSVRLFNKEPKIDGVDYDYMSVNLISSPIIEYNESYPYLVIGYDFANYADTDILIIYPYGIKKDILDINENLVSVNEKIEELRNKVAKHTVTDMTPLLVDGYRNKSNRTFTPSDTIKTAEFTVLAGDLIESNTMVVESALVGCCLLGSSNETIKAISTKQAQSYTITDEDINAGVVKASWCYRTTTQTEPFYLRMTRVFELIEEAPKDGKQYVRKNGNWVENSPIDEDSIFPLKGKKIVCFGDSQTENSDSSNKGIADYLAELSKATTVRGGVGGTRLSVRSSIVAEPTTSDECYAILDIPNLVDAWCRNEWTLVDKAVTWLKNNASDNNTSVITRLKDNPIETTDIVIVMGGGNNADDSTFGNHGDNDINHLSGGIDYIIKRLYETKPTLSVYFFNPPPRVKPMLTDPTNPIWSDEYRVNSGDGSLSFPNLCKKIIEVATENHVPCCDLYHNCGVTRWNVSTYANGSDTVHLTKAFPKYANLQYSFILANKNF